MTKANDYDDIPGTTVFDAQRARKGYHLNQFLYSLMKAENREEFLADEHKYLMKFPMTEEQRQAVMKRAWNRFSSLVASPTPWPSSPSPTSIPISTWPRKCPA